MVAPDSVGGCSIKCGSDVQHRTPRGSRQIVRHSGGTLGGTFCQTLRLFVRTLKLFVLLNASGQFATVRFSKLGHLGVCDWFFGDGPSFSCVKSIPYTPITFDYMRISCGASPMWGRTRALGTVPRRVFCKAWPNSSGEDVLTSTVQRANSAVTKITCISNTAVPRCNTWRDTAEGLFPLGPGYFLQLRSLILLILGDIYMSS